jgi:hypothetical protein
MAVNARVTLTSKEELKDNYNLKFAALYKEGENTWAYYTPSMNVTMTVRKEIGPLFEVGKTYSLDFNEVVATPLVDDVPPHV